MGVPGEIGVSAIELLYCIKSLKKTGKIVCAYRTMKKDWRKIYDEYWKMVKEDENHQRLTESGVS